MAYSTPRTWSAGEFPTAAEFNQDIRDNVAFLANPPAVRLTHSTSQSIAEATETVVTFDTESHDTDTMHGSGNPTRITFTTAGLYVVSFNGFIADSTGTYSDAYSQLKLNGATVLLYASGLRANTAAGPAYEFTTVRKFAAADYVEVLLYHDNSVNQARNLNNSNLSFSATWIGRG